MAQTINRPLLAQVWKIQLVVCWNIQNKLHYKRSAKSHGEKLSNELVEDFLYKMPWWTKGFIALHLTGWYHKLRYYLNNQNIWILYFLNIL